MVAMEDRDMGRPRAVDLDHLKMLVDSGMSRKEIAEKVGLSVGRVNNIASEQGWSKPQLDLSKYIPRGIKTEDRRMLREHQFLLLLGHLAETGEMTSTHDRMLAAFSWAKKHDDVGEAARYTPGRGFYYPKEDPEVSNLHQLVLATEQYFDVGRSRTLAKVQDQKEQSRALMEETEAALRKTPPRRRRKTA